MAESLRELAEHRGLKLVRSRRRKPGSGDFGKFGLTDEKGNSMLGIGKEGLTATAQDIEEYLRDYTANSWQQSAKVTPEAQKPRSEHKYAEAAGQSRQPRAKGRGVNSRTTAKTRSASSKHSRDASLVLDAASAQTPRSPETDTQQLDEKELSPQSRAGPAARPYREEPKPRLALRPPKPSDAEPLAKLLRQLGNIAVSEDDVTLNLLRLRNANAGMQVAELGGVVGCVAWAVVPTLHRGLVGRLTAILVDEDHRRKGIGTQLLGVAEAALGKRGCALLEVMSDIDITNSHNFFRTLKFLQTSYRFVREIAS